jgi:hypothetical protein
MYFEYFEELKVFDVSVEFDESDELNDFDLLRFRRLVITLTIVGHSFRDSFARQCLPLPLLSLE